MTGAAACCAMCLCVRRERSSTACRVAVGTIGVDAKDEIIRQLRRSLALERSRHAVTIDKMEAVVVEQMREQERVIESQERLITRLHEDVARYREELVVEKKKFHVVVRPSAPSFAV